MKESERLIRTQRFINRVDIAPKLIPNSPDSVDIAIRVLDSWSLVPKGSISSSRVSFGLNDRNFLGSGHQFENKIRNRFSDGKSAYSVAYSIPNIKNTFINTKVSYQIDLEEYYGKSIAIDRPFYSPLTKWAGGIYVDQQFRKDTLPDSNLIFAYQNFKYNTHDFWVGRAFKIFKGNNDNNRDFGFTSQAVDLPLTKNYIIVRFLLHRPESTTGVFNITDNPNTPVGVFIDDIEFTDCEWLQSLSLTSLAKNSDFAPLDNVTGGGPLEVGSNYILKVRPRIGNVWMPFGQSLEVIPAEVIDAENYQQWALTYYPSIGGFNDDYDQDGLPNGIEHILNLNPMNAADAEAALSTTINNSQLQISHPVIGGNQIEAECSFTLEAGSWEAIPVTISEDGIATASVDLSAANGKCFIRWRATEL